MLAFPKRKKSLTNIYAWNLDGLAHYAFHYVRDHTAVEDILQQAFVNVLAALGEHPRWNIKVRAYLYRTVRNLCIDELRRRRKLCMVANVDDFTPQKLGGQPVSLEWQDPSRDAVERQFILECLEKCLAELDEEQRLMFYYKYYEELNSKEIAAILGVTDGCVNTRMCRCRRILKRKMEVLLDERKA